MEFVEIEACDEGPGDEESEGSETSVEDIVNARDTLDNCERVLDGEIGEREQTVERMDEEVLEEIKDLEQDVASVVGEVCMVPQPVERRQELGSIHDSSTADRTI